ncbi:MAG TPA: COX15/CtaA family protein, partial [candidate division Zixibacteria bacterium]|nr:COX15/CtaA family protein [candidate division Zixibacteria bacterium]
LAWIEYINRLCGVVLGLLMIVAAVWVLIRFTRYLRVLLPVLIAALLTAFQGWQGSVVVSSQLEPIIVTVHMFLALVIVSLMIYATYEAYLIENKGNLPTGSLPRSLSAWFGTLWLIGLVQIIFGTQIRSAIEVIREQYPLETGAAWLSRVGAINHLHMTLGIVLLALSWYVTQVAFKHKAQLSSIMRQATVAMVTVVTLQFVLGMLFILMGMSAVRQVFHLWLASMYIGLTLLLYTMTRRREAHS